jgi:hypothetical protein
VADLSDELAAAEAELATAEEDVAVALAAVERANGRIDELELSVADLEAQLQEALEDRDALLLRFDPEIQAAVAAGQANVIQAACLRMTGSETGANIASVVADEAATWSEQPGLPAGADSQLDLETIRASVTECRDAAAAEALQAEMTSPKDDGFYTVGTEIAAGIWESTGSGDDCYWARLDSDQEIIDNHFGNAGGRITIRSSDAEVEFSDCGTWEYQG